MNIVSKYCELMKYTAMLKVNSEVQQITTVLAFHREHTQRTTAFVLTSSLLTNNTTNSTSSSSSSNSSCRSSNLLLLPWLVLSLTRTVLFITDIKINIDNNDNDYCHTISHYHLHLLLDKSIIIVNAITVIAIPIITITKNCIHNLCFRLLHQNCCYLSHRQWKNQICINAFTGTAPAAATTGELFA